jgi:hypothetical protein
MSEWWTYTLSDIQSFSLQTWYRLFERYNAAIWPAQIVALALGIWIGSGLHLPHRGSGLHTWRGRVITAILAASWLWIAIAFHGTRYAKLSWVAVYFAWGFGLEALLLIWSGVIRGRLTFERRPDAIGRAGLSIYLFALLVQPVLGQLLGRQWRQIEVFGVAPDPTAVGTLGILLLTTGHTRWELIAVPAIWCAISGATLAAMNAPAAWMVPAAAALVVILAAWRTLARSRTSGTSTNG